MLTQDQIYTKVSATLVEALNVDKDEVSPKATLQGDLGAESIDFLDIVFQLEQAFGVRIPRGQILEDARGPLSYDQFQQDGVISAAGLARLREVLDEVPAERIAAGLRVDDVAWLFTVETFCKVVLRAQAAEPGSG